MKLKMHQDVLGHKSGDEVEVDGTQAEWLVKEGYASVADGEDEYAQEDKHLVTSAEAKDDPTMAANREAPDEFDAAKAEDDADNSETDKAKAAASAATVRTGGATEKREPAPADTATTEGKARYDDPSDATPTAGPNAVPVDDSAPVPAVADKRETADDSKDSES